MSALQKASTVIFTVLLIVIAAGTVSWGIDWIVSPSDFENRCNALGGQKACFPLKCHCYKVREILVN